MKHDHVRDTLFNGFHPIDLIHAPKPAPTATAYTNNVYTVTVTHNDSPLPVSLFTPDNFIPHMEGLQELQNNLIFYSTILLFCVT